MTEGDGRLITERLFDIAARDPEKDLIIDPIFGRFTYAQAAAQVRNLASGLSRNGFAAGDVVILQLPNWAPFIFLHLALTCIGAITGNIPFVYRQREVSNILELTGAKALIVPRVFRGFDFVVMAKALLPVHETLSHIIVVDDYHDNQCDGMLHYTSLLRDATAPDLATLKTQQPKPEAITAVGFTSGTTGVLKGAMFDSYILNAVNQAFIDRFRLDGSDRIFGCSPLGHAVGFTHALRLTFAIEGSIVLQEHWNPADALRLIYEENCTFIAAATPFLMDIVNHPELAQYEHLPSLKVFLCGGASVPEELITLARNNLPNTFTSPLWGMTECGGVTTCPFDAPVKKRYTTDGKPYESMELKITDEAGTTLPVGQSGELMVRGPMVAKGYFGQPKLTAEYFLSDGFFRSGDQARMDEDGYIKITGRIKDLIIRGGVNISPVEVENILFSHPDVENVAVVGEPDQRLGERVCAFVIVKQGKTLCIGDLQEWLTAAGLAKPKWPERLESVSALPMTASGKVQKYRLREMLVGSLKQ